MVTELRRKNLLVRKGASQQAGIASQMFFEQIDASAMHGHGRRVRQLKSVLDVHLQNLMLLRGIATIGLQHYTHGCKAFTFRVTDLGAEFEQDRRARSAEC